MDLEKLAGRLSIARKEYNKTFEAGADDSQQDKYFNVGKEIASMLYPLIEDICEFGIFEVETGIGKNAVVESVKQIDAEQIIFTIKPVA